MAALTNTRREKFVQGLAEGLSGAESYRRAGYHGKGHTAEVGASEILSNPDVRARLAELKGKAAARHSVTIDSLIAELEEARQAALACDPPQTSAAVAATMGMAKLTGLLVERREVAVQHKPALSSKLIELDETEWRRQFDPAWLDEHTER